MWNVPNLYDFWKCIFIILSDGISRIGAKLVDSIRWMDYVYLCPQKILLFFSGSRNAYQFQ